MTSTPKNLRYMIFPQCKKEFELKYDDGVFDTLRIRSCPSGGVYSASINCCHCDYEEDL